MRSVETRSMFWLLGLACVALPAVPRVALAQVSIRRHSLVAETTFNEDDLLVGGTYRYHVLPEMQLGVFASFQARTEGVITLQEIRPHFLIQREEDRYLACAGVEKSFFPEGAFDVFVAAGAGYTFGDYEGSQVAPDEGWTFVGRGGGIFRIPVGGSSRVAVRLGYQYADLRTVPKGFGYLAVGGEF